MNGQICPICEQGILHDFVELDLCGSTRFEDDNKILCPSWYSICSFCGSEQADREQTSWNKKMILILRGEYEYFNFDLEKMKECVLEAQDPSKVFLVPHFDNFDDFDKWINSL